MRTTLNIDTPVLDELKRLLKSQEGKRKALGELVSELLTEALARRRAEVSEDFGFDWLAKPMKARLDLDDKEAVLAELDRTEPDAGP